MSLSFCANLALILKWDSTTIIIVLQSFKFFVYYSIVIILNNLEYFYCRAINVVLISTDTFQNKSLSLYHTSSPDDEYIRVSCQQTYPNKAVFRFLRFVSGTKCFTLVLWSAILRSSSNNIDSSSRKCCFSLYL